MGHGFRSLILALLFSSLLSCAGNSGNSGSSTVSNSTGGDSNGGSDGGSGSVSQAQHVVIVVLENMDYSTVVGSPLMPFFNNLATENALAAQFFANVHPSIGNYMLLTTGENPSGNDDSWTGTWSGDSVVRQLTAAGKTWKVYAESLPSAGYTGDAVGDYVKHHNPFVYFTDVIDSPEQAANIVPFSQFSVDLAANALPSYSFIIPNNVHDGHDCSTGGTNCPVTDRMTAADSWLGDNIPVLLNNSTAMANTIFIITFDESATDDTEGGGNVPVVFAGPMIKVGYKSNTNYQFESLLRFTLETLGVTNAPGTGSGAPSMGEFLK